jgi:GcrA cell cycle regulator
MWTQQTVETLRKFALEGRSAAWIAAALGAPSRNAVIGKANRIGIKLNGAMRGPPIGEEPPPLAKPWGRERSRTANSRQDIMPAFGGTAVSQARSHAGSPSREKKRANSLLFETAEIGEMRRIAFADVGEAQCRWPIGDPLQNDFAFCGLQVARGRAYCAGHCRLVYRWP